MSSDILPRKKLLLQWHITERCQLRCSHCYQEGRPAPELPFGDLLTILDQYMSLLAEWRETAGVNGAGHITLTGGDPFVRDDFLHLLEIIAGNRHLFSFAILTNGLALDCKTVSFLASLKPAFVQVSIEGGEATHDRIRGSGSFRQAVTGLKNLVRFGIPTMISFTAHRGNYTEFGRVAALGRRLKVSRVWADRLIPLGGGERLFDLLLSPRETREFFLIMEQERGRRQPWHTRFFRPQTEISMKRALQFLVGGGRPYRCTAGDRLIAVMANGDLVPCRRLPQVAGNLLTSSLTDLYRRDPLFQVLRDRDRLSTGCGSCGHGRTCGGGLRCLARAVFQEPFQADPGCWLADRRDSSPAGR